MEGTQVKAYKNEKTGVVTLNLEGVDEVNKMHDAFGEWLPKPKIEYVLDRETARRLAREMGEAAGASEEEIQEAIEEVS